MNNITVLLIAQVSILIGLPIFRRLLVFSDNDKIRVRKIYSSIVSLSLAGFSIIIFALTIHYLNANAFSNLTEEITLFSISGYNFALGFQLTQIRVLLFVGITSAVALINFYLVWSQEKWTIDQVDRISIYSVISILIILSPNFFQLLFFIIVADLVLIELLYSLNQEESKQKNLKIMTASFGVGDFLICTAFILLIRRSKSFDFDTILSDIQYKFFIFKPYFIVLCCLFLLGILAKSSLFPFHSWLPNICSKESTWKFNPIMINIVLGISLIFISPIYKLLVSVPNYYAWYGIIFSVIATLFAIFLVKEFEKQILVFSSSIGLLLISIGSGNLSSAFQLLMMLPFAFLGLVILSSKSIKIHIDSPTDQRSKKILRSIANILIVTIIMVSIISVIPFSSNLLTLGYLFTSNIVDLSLLVYILSIGSILGITLICIQISWKYFKQNLFKKLKFSELFPLIMILVFLSANSVLYPSFNILNPFSLPLNFSQENLSIALIPIFVGWFVILASYIVIESFAEKVSIFLNKFSTKIQEKLRKIYYFEFIFSPINWVNVKIVIPSSVWFYENVIRDFIYKVIIVSIFKFFFYLANLVKNFVNNVAVPRTVNFFKRSSQFIQSLENAKLKTQLLYIILGLGIMFAITIALYAGGII